MESTQIIIARRSYELRKSRGVGKGSWLLKRTRAQRGLVPGHVTPLNGIILREVRLAVDWFMLSERMGTFGSEKQGQDCLSEDPLCEHLPSRGGILSVA